MRIVLACLLVTAGLASAEPAKKAACKMKFVGKGLDRKAVCEFEAPVVVRQEAPKPNVVYVNTGGKRVTGRPKSGDRLDGLSHTLR